MQLVFFVKAWSLFSSLDNFPSLSEMDCYQGCSVMRSGCRREAFNEICWRCCWCWLAYCALSVWLEERRKWKKQIPPSILHHTNDFFLDYVIMPRMQWKTGQVAEHCFVKKRLHWLIMESQTVNMLLWTLQHFTSCVSVMTNKTLLINAREEKWPISRL